jgi:hypothetical protein
LKFEFIGYPVEESPAQPGVAVVFRPIVPVRIHGSESSLQFRGLLDTGADETIITRAMAEIVGATLIAGVEGRILSAGGEVRLSYARVDLEFGVGPERYRWPATVGVTETEWDEALLGFRVFLEYFDVLFFGHALQVELARNTRLLPESSTTS